MKKLISILFICLVLSHGIAFCDEPQFAIIYDSSIIHENIEKINTLNLLITGPGINTSGVTTQLYYYICPMAVDVFSELLVPGVVQDSWYAIDLVTGEKVIHKHGWYLLDFRNQEVKNAVMNAIISVIIAKKPAGIFIDHGEFLIYENNFLSEKSRDMACIDPEILGLWSQYLSEVMQWIKFYRKKIIINADQGSYFYWKRNINGIYVEDYRDGNEYQHRMFLQKESVIDTATIDRKMILIDPKNRWR